MGESRYTCEGKFQFPSNGKAHSDSRLWAIIWAVILFQFPSNGKAHSDPGMRSEWMRCLFGFNSLQTGRHIQTKNLLFSKKRLKIVSIPFKREGTFRQTPFSTHWGRGFRTPKPNAKCTSLFFSQNLPQKARKPTCPLTQTRFFNKNGSEVRHRLCSWAI